MARLAFVSVGKFGGSDSLSTLPSGINGGEPYRDA